MASKSLGTLTLDLVARTGGFVQGMSKAERESKKWRRQVEKDMHAVGNAAKLASAAAVAGLGAAVVQTVNSAREIQNLARLAGETPQEFQKAAYGTRRYGIEQDKLSDILKDTNDRIGDFIQTGGGPMADFFENIAPKVGVTAEQFAKLSGKDALQLYVKSLEEAGVSQKDMTFYMEAIASDATALIPLLRDNGKLMAELGDEAERTGNVFSDIEFQQLESVRRGMDELTGAATGMKNEIALAALPAIEDLVELLSDPTTIESAKTLGSAIVTTMNFVVKAVDGAVKVTQFLAEELAAFVHGPAFDDIPRLTEKFDDLNEAMEEQEKRLSRLKETPNLVSPEVLAVEEERLRVIKAEAEATKKLIESAQKAQAATVSGTGVNTVDVPDGSGGGSAGTTGGPISATGGLGGPKDVENGMAKRREALISAFQTERLAILAEYGRTQEEIKALEQVAIEDGGITQMQAADLRIKNEEAMQERLLQLRKDALDEEARLQQQRQALVLAGSEQLFGSLAQLTGTFAGEQTALYKTMFAVQKAASIAQAVVAIQTGIAQAAAVPFPANLAAMASVAAATAGIVGNIQSVGLNISGQAHDGIDSIPADGTWNLQKGERVVTAKTSAKLDATLERVAKGQGAGGQTVIINNAPPGTRTEESTDSQGNRVTEVILGDVATGGPISRTIQSTYGLKRQGR
ncbi:hypothetical protein [Cycloclasticus pugetii]|uniref:hypothetical protein n=1 Tax=Cycloclasticus pugetii TaxID=34068 RepID=UPI003A95136B